jgi:hypothetical protein
MTDQTNITDFDPATGRTTTTLVEAHDRGAQDWATAEGESHDTWHRPETEPPAEILQPTLTNIAPNTPTQSDTPIVITGTGTNFIDGATQILVNNTADPPLDPVFTTYPARVLSPTSLEFDYVPSVADQFYVRAKNSGNDLPSGTRTLSVLAPLPTATSITPNTCTVAQVGSVPATIVGTGLANCTSVQLVSADRTVWWPATVTSTTDTQIDVQTITSPATVAGDYTIVITDMVTNQNPNELAFTVTA